VDVNGGQISHFKAEFHASGNEFHTFVLNLFADRVSDKTTHDRCQEPQILECASWRALVRPAGL
jgi:hypothetical protein